MMLYYDQSQSVLNAGSACGLLYIQEKKVMGGIEIEQTVANNWVVSPHVQLLPAPEEAYPTSNQANN